MLLGGLSLHQISFQSYLLLNQQIRSSILDSNSTARLSSSLVCSSVQGSVEKGAKGLLIIFLPEIKNLGFCNKEMENRLKSVFFLSEVRTGRF